ncbi:MAG: hypothetical protein GY807_21095 [Gammaproteobacteria bacterium]|nr:hypothetical protein [Gammaproteobacteria bacterium]
MTIFPQMVMPGGVVDFQYEIEFVGAAATTSADTVSMPAHVVGDKIYCFAHREGNTTPPTIPSEGWSTIQSVTDGMGNSYSFVTKTAADSSEATGTFTNANSVAVGIWRWVDPDNQQSDFQLDWHSSEVGWGNKTSELESPGFCWNIGIAAGTNGGETVSDFLRTSPAATLRASANTGRWILVSDSNAAISTLSMESVTTGNPGETTAFEFSLNPIGSV